MDSLAARALAGGMEAIDDAVRMIALAWALSQTLAGFGVFALCGGIAAWPLDPWRMHGALPRRAAACGLLMTLIACGAFAPGLFRLDVMVMGAVVVAHAACRCWRAS